MTIEEAKTAFAVVANWRGQALDDGERAAWKNQLMRMEFAEFTTGIEAWARGTKSHLRPSLSDLWSLMPRSSDTEKYPPFPAPVTYERTDAAAVAMRAVMDQHANLRRPAMSRR